MVFLSPSICLQENNNAPQKYKPHKNKTFLYSIVNEKADTVSLQLDKIVIVLARKLWTMKPIIIRYNPII